MSNNKKCQHLTEDGKCGYWKDNDNGKLSECYYKDYFESGNVNCNYYNVCDEQIVLSGRCRYHTVDNKCTRVRGEDGEPVYTKCITNNANCKYYDPLFLNEKGAYKSIEETVTNDQTWVKAVLNKEDKNVNHPNHYNKGGIECIKAIEASMSFSEFQGFCKGNLIKYVWRYKEKNGLEDLKKAKVYLDWLIESYEKGQIS